MVTTIQVSETTMQMLKKLKERTNSISYDVAIRQLIVERPKESLFGAFASKKHYTREEILKDLRDENDRF